MSPFAVYEGYPFPFGPSESKRGINFSVIAPKANELSLCLFKNKPPFDQVGEINLNRTGYVWHVEVEHLPAELLYSFRVNGGNDLTLDPYAKGVITTNEWGANRANYSPLGRFNNEAFDWEGDKRPQHPLEDLIIYEMHVRAFSKHPSSGSTHPGTYLGLVDKISHLVDLGVTAIELMPIHEFNECEYSETNPITHEPLYNFWGYSTVSFFSPMQRYAVEDAEKEFKVLVKELHRHGIEVILDVVYNHTAEGNEKGPVLSFKGLDKKVYYMFDKGGHYLDFSGCGNTFNCNQAMVRNFIIDSLRYWFLEMHVDGFRFDLSSILTRGVGGTPLANPPLIEAISNDPVLSDAKLIAEPWDAAGLYQLGLFSKFGNWSEWNGRYRDIVRRFIKGSGATKGEFVNNLCGSQDLYYAVGPCGSVNFITAHDGFSLKDLVSYCRKHNLANGEHNRDGLNQNDSWNCGIEGPTHLPEVVELRERQMKNFILALMMSRGIPMVLMGDEYQHAKDGNNNSWCQDNDINWFRWDLLETRKEFFRFYQGMIHFRKNCPLVSSNKFLNPEDIVCHGVKLMRPEWGHEDFMIAYTIKNPENGNALYVSFNAKGKAATVELPKPANERKWRWIVNTSKKSPEDFFDEKEPPKYVEEAQYEMLPYSSLLLVNYGSI